MEKYISCYFFTDIPTCYVYPNCGEKNVDVVSYSFLGGFFDDTFSLTWSFQPDTSTNGVNRIILEISDFHVSCETGTEFEIYASPFTAVKRHCNKNKPIYPVLSLRIMVITFNLQLNDDQSAIVDGFKGHWKTVIRNFRPIDFATSYEEGR